MDGFDAWMTYLFEYEYHRRGAPWDEPEPEWLERYAHHDTPVAVAERILHLFGQAGTLLGGYRDEQVGRGLVQLVGGGDIHVLGGRDVPTVLRTRGLRAITTLFAEVFAPRILVEQVEGRSDLEYVCFMFFEIAPVDLAEDTVLDVMEDVLALESVPCQRAALHGLGHAHRHVPQHVPAIVDRWLARNRDAPQELRDYARAARAGTVM
ncbi:hypothetical protein QEZ54_24195 [Catellatospora sp. KI3]|uniref:hypothetical protein n=1 Tax=Catellatospora sp. KI3 TaxID=3041620 RepID=UPI002482CD76|nr:hypothetical protein [Catellatospora sp. KI3]MDI1464092.1 hypothetical protein [Catellatospora sp. KI3]